LLGLLGIKSNLFEPADRIDKREIATREFGPDFHFVFAVVDGEGAHGAATTQTANVRTATLAAMASASK
jgi:hypothetical protein